jgi:hypothetical protein
VFRCSGEPVDADLAAALATAAAEATDGSGGHRGNRAERERVVRFDNLDTGLPGETVTASPPSVLMLRGSVARACQPTAAPSVGHATPNSDFHDQPLIFTKRLRRADALYYAMTISATSASESTHTW